MNQVKQMFAEACMRHGAILFGSYARQLVFGEKQYEARDIDLHIPCSVIIPVERATSRIVELLMVVEKETQFYCHQNHMSKLSYGGQCMWGNYTVSYKDPWTGEVKADLFDIDVICWLAPTSQRYVCSLDGLRVQLADNMLRPEIFAPRMHPFVKPSDVLAHLHNRETLFNEFATEEDEQDECRHVFTYWRQRTIEVVDQFIALNVMGQIVADYAIQGKDWPYVIQPHLFWRARRMFRQGIKILNRGALPLIMFNFSEISC